MDLLTRVSVLEGVVSRSLTNRQNVRKSATKRWRGRGARNKMEMEEKMEALTT